MIKEKTIVTSHLSVSYGQHKVLDDVSVVVPERSITAIIGPNGSGKTTLLKTLLGVITPAQGDVRILGMSPRQARDYVAYVPQRFSFDQTMPITVAEFIAISIKKKTPEQLRDAFEHFNVMSYKDTPLGELSGGQLQRVLLARAFLQKPKILYLDEPEAGIDIGGEQDFYERVQHLHKKHNMTIILVSHEIDIVSLHATHVLCLNQQNVCFGEPQSVLKPENLKKLYGKDIAIFEHNHKKEK